MLLLAQLKDIFSFCTKGLLPGGFVADSSFVYLCPHAGRGGVYMYAENNLRCCASGTTCIFLKCFADLEYSVD